MVDSKELFNDVKSLMAITAEDNFVTLDVKENIEKGHLLIEAKCGTSCSGSVKTMVKDIYGEIEGKYNGKPVLKSIDCLSAPLVWLYSDECNHKLYVTASYEDESERYTAAISPLVAKK